MRKSKFEEIELDDLIFWYYYDWKKHQKIMKYHLLIIAILMFLFEGTLIFNAKDTWKTLSMLCFCVYGLFVTVYVAVTYRKSTKMYNAFSKKLELIPHQMLINAQNMESDFTIAALWAIECYEGHIHGDCPLCGAT